MEEEERRQSKIVEGLNNLKVKVVSVSSNCGREIATKAREILNKKVSVKVLVLVILLSLGAGRLSNFVVKDTKEYDISDIYVGTYYDYYDIERLAVLTKEIASDTSLSYYREINDSFSSDEVKVSNIRLLYTCLNDGDLKKIRKKGNKLTVDEINKYLDTVVKLGLKKAEDEQAEKEFDVDKLEEEDLKNLTSKEKEIYLKEKGLYDPKDLELGVYSDVTGEWQCDVFKWTGSEYTQYEGLFRASIRDVSTISAKLVTVDNLTILLTADEQKEVINNLGLSKEKIEAIKSRAYQLIKEGKYVPLNNYLSEIFVAGDRSYSNIEVKEKEETNEETDKKVDDNELLEAEDQVQDIEVNLTDSVDFVKTTDMYCVVYSVGTLGDKKLFLYDASLNEYYDENGKFHSNEKVFKLLYPEDKILMSETPLSSYDTPEIREKIGEELDKEILSLEDIKKICNTLKEEVLGEKKDTIEESEDTIEENEEVSLGLR